MGRSLVLLAVLSAFGTAVTHVAVEKNISQYCTNMQGLCAMAAVLCAIVAYAHRTSALTMRCYTTAAIFWLLVNPSALIIPPLLWASMCFGFGVWWSEKTDPAASLARCIVRASAAGCAMAAATYGVLRSYFLYVDESIIDVIVLQTCGFGIAALLMALTKRDYGLWKLSAPRVA